MSEWVRLICEGLGVSIVVVALAMVYLPLGLLVLGLVLILAANFYLRGEGDAGPE